MRKLSQCAQGHPVGEPGFKARPPGPSIHALNLSLFPFTFIHSIIYYVLLSIPGTVVSKFWVFQILFETFVIRTH